MHPPRGITSLRTDKKLLLYFYTQYSGYTFGVLILSSKRSQDDKNCRIGKVF